jgi:hypothetical protein
MDWKFPCKAQTALQTLGESIEDKMKIIERPPPELHNLLTTDALRQVLTIDLILPI